MIYYYNISRYCLFRLTLIVNNQQWSIFLTESRIFHITDVIAGLLKQSSALLPPIKSIKCEMEITARRTEAIIGSLNRLLENVFFNWLEIYYNIYFEVMKHDKSDKK